MNNSRKVKCYIKNCGSSERCLLDGVHTDMNSPGFSFYGYFNKQFNMNNILIQFSVFKTVRCVWVKRLLCSTKNLKYKQPLTL